MVINMFINSLFHMSVDFNHKCLYKDIYPAERCFSALHRNSPSEGVIFFTVLYLKDFII